MSGHSTRLTRERAIATRPGNLHYGWVIMMTVMAVVFGSVALGRHGYAVILPTMKDALGLS